MPNSTSKKGTGAAAKKGASKSAGGAKLPAALAPSSVIGEDELTSPQPGGRKYRVIETNQVDTYEPTDVRPGVMSPAFMAAKPAPTGDNFQGTARKAAKLSIAKAPTEKFTDVKDLIATLPAISVMKKHKPPITTDANSNRVTEEKRNVRVRAFIYAASREDDNDFHLIVGRSPKAKQRMYMTMELSGLPPAGNASHAKLKAARAAYKKFFDKTLPGFSYKFYQPPVPVEIEGSLFFDMSHATGSRPGPPALSKDMPTVWEVHPITDIVFEP
jgi:hypothetical protein